MICSAAWRRTQKLKQNALAREWSSQYMNVSKRQAMIGRLRNLADPDASCWQGILSRSSRLSSGGSDVAFSATANARMLAH